jgi:hypothetical protein
VKLALALALASLALGGASCKGANGAQMAEATTALAVNAVVAAAEAARAPGAPESSHLAASLDEPPTGPKPIDLEHARGVLQGVDLGACWPAGAKRAPRDVEVTFRRDGTVLRVAVPRPAGLVTFDEPCVGARLKDVIIDPFLGDDTVVSVTFGDL